MFHFILFHYYYYFSQAMCEAHLLEDQRALSGPHGLRQLGDAALVQVGPREAPVVDEDL